MPRPENRAHGRGFSFWKPPGGLARNAGSSSKRSGSGAGRRKLLRTRNGVMKLVKTSVTGSTVWMRFADDDDPAKAKEWIDVQVPVNALKAPAKKLGMFAQADVD